MKRLFLYFFLFLSIFAISSNTPTFIYAKSYKGMEELAIDLYPKVLKLQTKKGKDAISKLKSDDYKLIKYEDIMRKREGLEDERHQFFAEVQQYDESDDIAEGLFMRDGDLDRAYYFIIPNLPETRLMEGDNVDVYGTLHGLLTYETVMGGTKTVPVIIVDKILVQGVDY